MKFVSSLIVDYIIKPTIAFWLVQQVHKKLKVKLATQQSYVHNNK